jgi:hypothetical protein
MIQRIQTIWLLISAISSLLLIKGGIINLIDKAGQKYYTGFSGTFKLSTSGPEIITGSVSLSALIIIIPVVSVITLLLFKWRRIQKVLALVLVSLSSCLIILIAYYSFILMRNYDSELIPGFKMVLPLIILIASILAYKGISGDDNLIKSYDRLR